MNNIRSCYFQGLIEKNVDEIFPLLSTDPNMVAKEALLGYKYQPRLEKRFTQFKSIHKVAPLLFKKIERVEGIMFLFFVALMLLAIIEREVDVKYEKSTFFGFLCAENRIDDRAHVCL